MHYKTYLVVLDFPIATTGDIYSPEVVGSAIAAHRYRIDNRLFLGCFVDNKDDLDKTQKIDDLVGIDANPALKLEIIQIKKNLNYYRLRSHNISHVIEDMYIEGDNWVAEIETLSTGKGLKLEKCLKDNAASIKFRPVVVRERASGMVTSINDIVSIDAVLKT